jgi:hypothetical protein
MHPSFFLLDLHVAGCWLDASLTVVLADGGGAEFPGNGRALGAPMVRLNLSEQIHVKVGVWASRVAAMRGKESSSQAWHVILAA